MASGKVRIALCNAVLGHLDFAAQCAYAAALGYDGLEVVPHTLDATPQSLTAARCATFRRAAADAGIAITGLHRLMSAVTHLSIVASDANVHRATVEFLQRMVDVCANLGGRVIVHGSPQQRSLPPDMAHPEGWGRARDAFAAIATHAHGTPVVRIASACATSPDNLNAPRGRAVTVRPPPPPPPLPPPPPRPMRPCSACVVPPL